MWLQSLHVTLGICLVVHCWESLNTPPEISEGVVGLPLGVQTVAEVRVEEMEKETALEKLDSDLVADYTWNEDMAFRLRQKTGRSRYVRLWTRQGLLSGESFLHSYSQSFTSFLLQLPVPSVHVLYTPAYIPLLTHLQQHWPHIYHPLACIPPLSLSKALQIVGKIVKPAGINHLAIFTDPLTAGNLLTAFDQKRLNKAGYVYILSQTASLYRYFSQFTSFQHTGVLFIGESALLSKNMHEYTSLILQNQLIRLISTVNSTISVEFTLPAPQFYLFSLENGQPRLQIEPFSISFPGNITTLPLNWRPEIAASVNYPFFDDFQLGYYQMRGILLAFEEINTNTGLIPNYYLVNNTVNYLNSAFNYSFTQLEIRKNSEKMGITYFGPQNSHGIKTILTAFEAEKVKIPILASSVACLLSNKEKFPLYLRPKINNSFISIVTLRLLRSFQWSKVSLLYVSDQGDSLDFYSNFRQKSDFYSIQILNNESFRSLPETFNYDSELAINASLLEIKSKETRVVIVCVPYFEEIVKRMRELEMKEYLMIFVTGVSLVRLGQEWGEVGEVMKGALVLTPSLFVGEVGREVRRKLERVDGEKYVPSTCLDYDLTYLYFHAVDYLLQRGLDYEDASTLINSMRDTHFIGCSGFFKIQKDSNDRDESRIEIHNFQVDKSSFRLQKVGLIDPYGVSLIRIFETIQWPDGERVFPDVKPRYLNCPYVKRGVVQTYVSGVIAVVIYFSVMGLAVCSVALTWGQWRGCSPEVLKRKQMLSFEDVSVYISLIIDYFQYISLGPDISPLILQIWSTSSTLTFQDFLHIQGAYYWLLLDLVLSCTVLWTILCCLIFLSVLLSSKCKRWLQDCSVMLWMPVASNTMFFPIISVLTSVYMCSHGLSPALKDSFMDKDCLTFCWHGTHLNYVLGSTAVLVVYIPVALVTRPIWQELQANLHIKAYPTSLLVKGLVQVGLIGLAGILRTTSPAVHSYLYVTVMSLYIGYMLSHRQFNYSRVNMWQVLQMLASLSLSIMGIVQSHTSRLVLVSTLFSLYFLLIISGLCIQSLVKTYHSQLIRQKTKDIRGLLEFAFTKGNRAANALQNYYQVNNLSPTEQNFVPTSTSHNMLV